MYRRTGRLRNAYWDDKKPDLSKIEIPTYLTGSYSSNVHVVRSIRGWLEIAAKDKWFRINPRQEWYDIWAEPESTDELQAFLDRYLKNIDDGWEKTPRMRVTILRSGEKDPDHGIVVDDFPLPNTEYKISYLGPDGRLWDRISETTASSISYDSTTRACAKFAISSRAERGLSDC